MNNKPMLSDEERDSLNAEIDTIAKGLGAALEEAALELEKFIRQFMVHILTDELLQEELAMEQEIKPAKFDCVSDYLEACGYEVVDEHFVKGDEKIPLTEIAGHTPVTFAEKLRRG